jgi:superfamily II DNA or RNA helicase
VARPVPYGDVTLIEVSGADTANRGTRASFLLPYETLEPVAVSDVPQVVRPARWRRIARAVLAHATPTAHALRAAARARLTIVPFQLEPALAVTGGRGCRLLIADEVGLGKTIQAGLVVAEVFAREPDARALVVCPAGLREQWRTELEERFSLPAVVLDAAAIARLASEHGPDINPWMSIGLVVTSIDYMKRPEVIRAVEAIVWDVVVFDEAHALAGPSDRATCAAALAMRARRVVLLTATPHSGDEDAFRRLCAIGRLAHAPPLIVFRRTRADAGVSRVRRSTMLSVRPSRPEMAVHDALVAYARRVWSSSSAAHPGARLAMTVLMRRACSSVTSLAESVERRRSLLRAAPADMTQLTLPFLESDGDEQPSLLLGTPGLDDAAEEERTLGRLLALAREAARHESKVAALVRLLRRVHEPVLVFTEYRDTLAHLEERLPIPAVTLHGGMTPRQRQAATREFTEGSAALLLATDAASEGLNLQKRCRLVVNLELPWSPLRLEQRIGRVDRIGQSQSVHALHLVARGTGEESVVARLFARQARARASLEQIGEAVVRGADLPAAGVGPSPAPLGDVVSLDLRAEAHTEAERLLTARGLTDSTPVTSSHPVISVVRRRARPTCRRVWTWRLTFVDDSGRLIHESLLPLCAEANRGGRTTEGARASLDSSDPDLRAFVQQEQARRLAALAAEMKTPIALLTGREQAIAQVLDERHARLAAPLLQSGLFDRRAERAAAAQATVLNQARSRIAARLIQLEASSRPVVEDCRLVFAVALE